MSSSDFKSIINDNSARAIIGLIPIIYVVLFSACGIVRMDGVFFILALLPSILLIIPQEKLKFNRALAIVCGLILLVTFAMYAADAFWFYSEYMMGIYYMDLIFFLLADGMILFLYIMEAISAIILFIPDGSAQNAPADANTAKISRINYESKSIFGLVLVVATILFFTFHDYIFSGILFFLMALPGMVLIIPRENIRYNKVLSIICIVLSVIGIILALVYAFYSLSFALDPSTDMMQYIGFLICDFITVVVAAYGLFCSYLLRVPN